MQSTPPIRPTLTSHALRRWVPPLVRHLPAVASAYLLPGRVSPRIREAAMLGVTSINRCEACEAVHGRWAAEIGLRLDDLSPNEAAAYAFGQRVAVSGPHDARPPVEMRGRHRRELMAVSILMELANLAGNRFLASHTAAPDLQVGDRPPDEQTGADAWGLMMQTCATAQLPDTLGSLDVSTPVPSWVRHNAPAGRGFVPWR